MWDLSCPAFDWVMQSITRNKVHVYMYSAIRKQYLWFTVKFGGEVLMKVSLISWTKWSWVWNLYHGGGSLVYRELHTLSFYSKGYVLCRKSEKEVTYVYREIKSYMKYILEKIEETFTD